MRVARVVLVLAALLAGCQNLTSYPRDESSPYYTVPEGARFTLNREVAFAPQEVSLYIQNGRILSMPDVQQYDPFCKFELFHRRDTARTIGPAEMTVTDTLWYQMPIAFSRAGPLLYADASLSMKAQAGGELEGGVQVRSYVMRMDLRSAEEPDIHRLTCARWYYPSMEDRVTVGEIRRTLAPLFTLRLPPGG